MALSDFNVTSPLLPLLGVGVENARTGKELGNILGWRDSEVRSEVNRLRKMGVPICASVYGCKGYYLPANSREAIIYGRQFRARLADAQKACAVFSQFVDHDVQCEFDVESKVAAGQGDYN